jgi:carbonic anhydrase/acetyltransferase-like protein (isoleucine patch superfamily)
VRTVSGLILPFRNVMPTLGPGAFVANTAVVIGNVEIGAEASIWFGVVVRGDVHNIRIGARTNVQDNTVIHVTEGRFGTTIGNDVLIGHGCIIHGCTLEDGCFVGMGSTILDGARVEKGAMVGAGSLVTPGKVVKAGELWTGRPAKLGRPLTDQDRAAMKSGVDHYVELAKVYGGDRR